ncbi:MAG TPA: hypothetical protein VGQ84_09965 [Gaiellaceae bacterium]|nr:hypothetical protein [Gaiellaceae bacterium]
MLRNVPSVRSSFAAGAFLVLTGLLALAPAPRPGSHEPGAAVAAPGRSDLPLDFVANRGQWPASTRFVAHQGARTATFERGGIKLYVSAAQRTPVSLTFEGASSAATIAGERRRSGRYNFVFGNDPKRWRSNVPSYGSLLYRGLYDGVDVRVREDLGRLEYDVLLAPGADLDQVVIGAAGTTGLRIAHDGALLLRTRAGPLRQAAPAAWEVLPGGSKRRVASRFRLLGAQRFGLEVPARDPARALVIDPGLDWATYLGGAGDESVEGLVMTSDGTGDVVLAGQTASPDFPHTNGNLTPVGWVPYVARVNSTGTALVYATFFGGSFNHSVNDVALDAANRPVVVGDTNSLDFPTTPGAYDRTPGNGISGDYDAYAIKFDAAGGPLFGTYLAGSPNAGWEQARAAGFDAAGGVIVAGFTTAADFPTTVGAYDRTLASKDIFVSRLDPTGSTLTYSTFLGGEAGDDVFDMAVDGQGFVTLTGQTSSTTFPWTADAFDPSYNAYGDAFVTRLKLEGAGAADLKYSTFLGGAQYVEAGDGIAVDPANPSLVTVSGFTRSGDFPTTLGVLLRTHFAPVDTTMGFVARFSFPTAGGGSLQWSTFYGAPGNQTADDVVVDSTGAAIIVGGTAANNPPTTERAYDRIPGERGLGKADAYVARISADGSRVLYSTLLGGSNGDWAGNVVSAGGTSVVIAGLTNATDFPVTAGALDTVYAADGKPSDRSAPGTLAEDVFVARLTLEAPAAADTTPPPAPELRGPADGSTYFVPTSNVTLDWADVADPSGIAAYHLQGSPNPTFTNDFNAELRGWFEPWLPTSVLVQGFSVSHTGTFYWRVQALDRAGNLGPWSAVRTINVVDPPLTTPTLVRPANGGSFAPGSVTFVWNSVGARYYQLQVDTRSDFTSGSSVWATYLTQPWATLTLNNQQRYWWRVRSANEISVGAWSTVWSFELRSGSPATPPPPSTSPPPPGAGTALAGVDLNQDIAYTGGPAVQGTVTLNGGAPAGGAVVPLAANYPDRLIVPPTVTVPAGSTSATFTVTPGQTTVNAASVMISGEYGGVTAGDILFIYPETPALELNGFTVSTSTPSPGGVVQGTVSIQFPATAGGIVVMLGSTDPALAAVPPSVTIPQGLTSATFSITTQPVTKATDVTILASRSMTLRQTLQLLPPGALADLSLNPATVTGGTPSTGTITLTSPAPAGGVAVALSSHDTTVATVPASITVPAGAASATFTVTTKVVCCQGHWSIISASAGGITRSQTINVNPGSGSPPPGTDSVSITRAEYTVSSKSLRLEATSTSSSATLKAYVSSTDALIGTLSNNGGGRYSGQFSWPTNPQTIVVWSSLRGSATKAVTAK